MDITHQYMKKRCNYGHQPLFCEYGPEMCDSIVTDPKLHKEFILRNPVHEANQNAPEFSAHNINTIRAEYTNTGANHQEGGWPKDVNIHDPEATQRYRRRIEKEEDYIHCVNSKAGQTEHYIMQNNAVDLYRTFYIEMMKLPEPEKNSVRTVNVYRDVHKRPVISLNWQPKGYQFCTCYVDIDFYRQSNTVISAYLWNVEMANSPEVTLYPSCPMFDLKYSPRDPKILVSGLASGQVAAFDTRVGSYSVAECEMHVAHRDLTRKVLFISSKSGQEFFSSSPDGVCKWWDLRNLAEPTEEMIIDPVTSSFDVQKMTSACGVSVLEYEHTIPTRFMVGTDNGLVIGGNRKGKTPMEKLPVKYEAHLGPVRSVERNPYFPKNFLTVGDWTVKVWSEDCRESPVLWLPPLRYHVNCATWSPTRLSLMLLASSNGRLLLWDILRRQHETILSMQLSTEPLLTMAMHQEGTIMAVGNSVGNIFLVELSQSLSESGKLDKAQMTAIFERENARERILEARMREIRLKLKQAEEGSPRGSLSDLDPSVGDKDLAEATTEYMSIVKKEMSLMV